MKEMVKYMATGRTAILVGASRNSVDCSRAPRKSQVGSEKASRKRLSNCPSKYCDRGLTSDGVNNGVKVDMIDIAPSSGVLCT